MVKVTLKEFVNTGRFGPVALGQSRAELRGHLGEPDDLEAPSRRRRKARIWKYGDFEFHFQDPEDFLWLVYTDSFEVPQGDVDLLIDPWILRRTLSQAELEAGLRSLALAYNAEHDELRELTIIRMESGVEFAFEADFHNPSGPPVLGAISLAWQS